ncbi:MAG: dihydroorotate dehydrogenase [Candidatus Aadella gelida]|nr:dihydroorotate dehydrogenase [Candidatus Aadella gelida]
MADKKMEIKIGEAVFKNPIWVASGTFGNGEEFRDFVDLEKVGAIITKTVTLNAREGNPPPRIVETSSGLLNSIGLENGGVEFFIKEHLPLLKKIDTRVIVSIAGQDDEDFVKCTLKIMEGALAPDGIEVNLSCPNVSHGKTKYRLLAQDPKGTERIIRKIKKETDKIIIAKLSPNVTDIAEIAYAAEQGGADAVSLVNTYLGLAVDANERKPILGNVAGGLSGPAIKPLALRAVWDAYKKIKIPIIGIGGIMNGTDVAEFMLCGARAVQIGTANLASPDAYERILGEFEDYLDKQKIEKAENLTGALKVKG